MTPSELFEAEFVTCVPACLLCDGGTEPVDLCVSPTILVEDDDESPGVTLDVLADDGATRELVALSLDGAELLGRELLRAAAQARGRHGAARGEA